MELNKIYHGDCIEVMKTFPDNSVDAIVTDSPYGLEFMGKEWDKFEPKRLNQRWSGKERKLIGDGSGKGGDFGERFNEMPKSIPNKNKKCIKGTPCTMWEINTQYQNAFQNFTYDWAKECLRILKPGGHLLSFGGSRTYHRMACAIEDAGFEIRNQIMWVYSTGFPKSHNIGKAVDKLQGNEREVVGTKKGQGNIPNDRGNWGLKPNEDVIVDKGNSEWEGWGTALKPAHEPICMARKPLSEKSVAENVLKWRTGGINIDKCRIECGNEHMRGNVGAKITKSVWKDNSGFGKPFVATDSPLGRFPSNLIHDGSEEVVALFPETTNQGHWSKNKITGFGKFGDGKYEYYGVGEKDKSCGSAARFFYCAKSSKGERNEGLEGFEGVYKSYVKNRRCRICGHQEVSGSPCTCENPDWEVIERETTTKNNHPTVKPIALMEYLIKLVTPKGGLVLDPFIGSGTTAIAARLNNFKFIGIEKEAEYVKIAGGRIKQYLEQRKLDEGWL